MTPPRSSALSEARRAQLEACRTIVRAEDAAERLIGMFTWSDVCRWSENDGDIAYDYARATAHLCRLALDAEALLRAEASPPAALPAETPEQIIRDWMPKLGLTPDPTHDIGQMLWAIRVAGRADTVPAETPRAETCINCGGTEMAPELMRSIEDGNIGPFCSECWAYVPSAHQHAAINRLLNHPAVTVDVLAECGVDYAANPSPPQASRPVEGDETP